MANSQPGQTALPGGKMDDGGELLSSDFELSASLSSDYRSLTRFTWFQPAKDLNLIATARREAFEEIGLPLSDNAVRYITCLPPFLARSLLVVTPVVFLILDYTLKVSHCSPRVVTLL